MMILYESLGIAAGIIGLVCCELLVGALWIGGWFDANKVR